MAKTDWMGWLVSMAAEIGGTVTVSNGITVVISAEQFISVPGTHLDAIFKCTDFVQEIMLRNPKPEWFGVYIEAPE